MSEDADYIPRITGQCSLCHFTFDLTQGMTCPRCHATGVSSATNTLGAWEQARMDMSTSPLQDKHDGARHDWYSRWLSWSSQQRKDQERQQAESDWLEEHVANAPEPKSNS